MPKLLASYVLFPFVGRQNMPDADARTQNAQYLDLADDRSAACELQRVLSLSSPSFYRCALRLLGNRHDAEDAVQEALLAAHKHLHQEARQTRPGLEFELPSVRRPSLPKFVFAADTSNANKSRRFRRPIDL